MIKILLDTNAYVKLASQDKEVFKVISEAESVVIPSIVIGELIEGFYGGTQFDKNRKTLNEFIDDLNIQIWDIGYQTAEIYGEIKNELKKKGTPIPANDIWIAASAIENGAKLITYDKHFLNIQGLRLWNIIKN